MNMCHASAFPNYNYDMLRKAFEPSREKSTICIGENKDADQLRGYREADQRLCFHHMDSTVPLLLISKVSGF